MKVTTMQQRVVTCLAAAIIVSTACGGPSAPSPTATERISTRQLAAQIGCVGYRLDQDTELFVREQAGCGLAEDAVDTYPVTIYTFTDGQARDNWIEAARSFGVGPLVVGPTWVVSVETNCDPANPCSAEERAADIQAKIGGEIQ
jgi:hypothetical protein